MPSPANEPVNDTLLTIRDVAEILDLGQRTVWRLEAEGRLPKAIRLNRRVVRWKASAIQSYIDQLGTAEQN